MSKRIAASAVLAVALLLVGCSTGQRLGPSGDDPPQLSSPLGLPSLPADKDTSTQTILNISGDGAISTGGSAVVEPPNMTLTAESGDMSWALWRLSPGSSTPVSLAVTLTSTSESGVYLAVGDYTTGLWQFSGPWLETTALAVDRNNVSPAGGLFVAAIVHGAAGSISDLSLTVESAWSILTLDAQGNAGDFSSLAVVDGFPAIAYHSDAGLKFARAASPDGASLADWNLVTVEQGVETGLYCSLAVVGGNPAISYHDDANDDLKFARASTAAGALPTDWSAIVVDNGSGYPNTQMGVLTSLAVIDERPAISYIHRRGSGPVVCFAWSDTASGEGLEDWGKVYIWNYGDDEINHTSLMDVDGLPAMCLAVDFADTEDWDVSAYATAPEGAWLDPYEWSLQYFSSGGDDAAMCLVDGFPALVCFLAREPSHFYFWNSQLIPDTDYLYWSGWFNPLPDGTSGGKDLSLAEILNSDLLGPATFPAVSHISPSGANNNLMYTWSRTTRGEHQEDWSSETVDCGSYAATSLACVNGKPAISYYDSADGDLKYAIQIGN